ncbi:MAG TPA: c-type cytochrome [Nannocystis exedens]|nr:c-type cytochrome [Nannocystis exedens]
MSLRPHGSPRAEFCWREPGRVGVGRVGQAGLALLCFAWLTACGGSGGETPPKRRRAESSASAKPTIDPAVLRAIAAGEKLFFDRAVCSTCHRVGERGTMVVGPNLGIGDGMSQVLASRVPARRPELSPIEYVVESMLDPDAVVVASYAPGVMKAIDDLPNKLKDDEIVNVAAYVAANGADEALKPADLEAAQARIAPARAARAARRQAKITGG